MPNIARNRKKVSLVVILVAIFLTGAWFMHRTEVHPQFGRIYVAGMSEHYTYWQFARLTVSKWLHRLPQKPYYDLGLQVGPDVLGWSSHENSPSKRDGYIYMRNPLPSGGNEPLWEFALTTKRRLSEVTSDDLKCEYFGMNDPRGTNIFGAALTYTTFDAGQRNPEHATITPSAAQWSEFRRTLDDLKLWQWRTNYPNTGTLDGTQWSLDIAYADHALKTHGDNSYPDAHGKPNGKPSSTKAFKRYLASVEKLTGKDFQ